MIRMLVLAGVALALTSLVNEGFERLKSRLGGGTTPDGSPESIPGGARHGELVACSSCGVHILRSRALLDDASRVFCTEGCRHSATSTL